MNQSKWVHPEVLAMVNNEFKRLYAKHPDCDGNALWEFARDYAFAVCLADTELLKVEYNIKISRGTI